MCSCVCSPSRSSKGSVGESAGGGVISRGRAETARAAQSARGREKERRHEYLRACTDEHRCTRRHSVSCWIAHTHCTQCVPESNILCRKRVANEVIGLRICARGHTSTQGNAHLIGPGGVGCNRRAGGGRCPLQGPRWLEDDVLARRGRALRALLGEAARAAFPSDSLRPVDISRAVLCRHRHCTESERDDMRGLAYCARRVTAEQARQHVS